jgi:Zn-dependent protease/predicted transcriptional regulator
VKIGLHASWFLIAALIILSLAQHFRIEQETWSTGVVWVTAIATGLLFFAAVLAHELSHALVARQRGLSVHSITLFALGGVAQIEGEADDAKTEFWMGAAGPIASLAIGLACLGLARALGWTLDFDPATPPQALCVWLGYINLSLAFFNLIPGFPLDGGRMLRALLWWITGEPLRATRNATRTGQAVALVFMGAGLVSFLRMGGLGGLWVAFIGWFLLRAASSTRRYVEILERLRGVTVGDLMARECATVDARTNVQGFVESHVLQTDRRWFVVVENGAVTGLVTPEDVEDVQRSRWTETLVEDVMKPLMHLTTVAPTTPASESLETMTRDDVKQLPVIAEGRLQGIICRTHILQFLQVRAAQMSA